MERAGRPDLRLRRRDRRSCVEVAQACALALDVDECEATRGERQREDCKAGEREHASSHSSPRPEAFHPSPPFAVASPSAAARAAALGERLLPGCTTVGRA